MIPFQPRPQPALAIQFFQAVATFNGEAGEVGDDGHDFQILFTENLRKTGSVHVNQAINRILGPNGDRDRRSDAVNNDALGAVKTRIVAGIGGENGHFLMDGFQSDGLGNIDNIVFLN